MSELPDYIVRQSDNNHSSVFQRQTRQFNERDTLKTKCTVTPRVDIFRNSFFYRTHLAWNDLPMELRNITNTTTFKTELIRYLWSKIDGM